MHLMAGGDGGPSVLACWVDQIKNTAGQLLRVTQSQNQVADNFYPSNMKTEQNLLI